MPTGIEEYAALFISPVLLAVSVIFFMSFYRKPTVYCKFFGKFRLGMNLFIISFGLYLVIELLEVLESPIIDAIEDYMQIAAFLIWICALSYFMIKSKGE